MVNLVGLAVGAYGVARRADRSAVEVWAVVAAFAWLGGVGFVGMIDGRFSVAFYGAQLMGVLAALLARRLTLMCEDLLAATTFDHTDLVITPADLDLSQQLAECAGSFPDLDLRIACPRDVRVHADPLRLQQILSNLVRNAQVHGAEPITVDVSSDPRTVTIRASDAGEGVPEGFIPRLFERYSQGARALSGAGIGLSVVHDLVQAHGGTIRYDLTQPAFIVTLPVGASAEPPPEGRVLTAPRLGHVTI